MSITNVSKKTKNKILESMSHVSRFIFPSTRSLVNALMKIIPNMCPWCHKVRQCSKARHISLIPPVCHHNSRPWPKGFFTQASCRPFLYLIPHLVARHRAAEPSGLFFFGLDICWRKTKGLLFVASPPPPSFSFSIARALVRGMWPN